MNTDLNSLNLKVSNYSYALNATVEDISGEEFILQNTSSNLLKTIFPEGYHVIGHKNIHEQNRVLYFLINEETNSYIVGEILNKEYEDITDIEKDCINGDCGDYYNEEQKPLENIKQKEYSSFYQIESISCLNLNRNYPIDIEYKITNCGLNIYFTDNLNPRRYIYFDYTSDISSNLKIQQEFYTIIGFDTFNCNQPIYSTEIDCNKIDYNRCFEKPCISFVDLTNLGILKSGVYQFLFSYSDKNGEPLTNYFPSTATIPVFDKKITTITDYVTDKAIIIDINNIDNITYSYYNLVVAESFEGFTEYKLIGTFPTNQNISTTTDRYTYTGYDKTLKKLSAQEIFARKPYYSKAKSVTKANNYLFYGGLDEYKPLNLQQAANKVKLYWQTVAIKESVYEKARSTFNFRTYQRDEVYAFGIIFEYCDGYETCCFHIPGPSASYFSNTYAVNVNQVITNNDIITDNSCAGASLNKMWQIYNTAKVITGLSNYKYTNNCDTINCWETGDFAYWESTERYPNIPNVWGELCGEPIRHHKFPDSCVTHIHDGSCQNKDFNENNIVYPIGLKVDSNSINQALVYAVENNLITKEERDKIVSYRIVRGDRSGHKSIIAKGLLYDVWEYTKDGKQFCYANYPYNDLSPDNFLAPNKNTYKENPLVKGSLPNQSGPNPTSFTAKGRYTFHSPDIHFVNPNIGSILKLETAEYGKSEGFFNHCEEQAKYKRLSFFSRLIALGMGIAASLSATEEKDCVTYTVKGNYAFKQDKFNVDSNGKAPYGNVSGALTLGTGSISTSEASGQWNGTAKVPDITSTQDNTTCIALVEADKTTGQNNTKTNNPIIQAAIDKIKACKNLPDDADSDAVVEQYTKTTCRGTPYQLLNINTDNKVMQSLNLIMNGFITGGPQILSQILLGFKEMEIVLDLLKSLIPAKNYAIQYNSIGKYNNYACVPNNLGIKQRSLFQSSYLKSDIETIPEPVGTAAYYPTTTFNNLYRESSVYLAVEPSKLLLKPQEIASCVYTDNSRCTMNQAGLKYDDLNKSIKRNISSFYASIKNFVPDQYGKIYNIQYLETNACSFKLDEQRSSCEESLFGGDTFINRFALKRKHSFFLQSRFKQADGSDVRYSELGNAAFPNYYIDSAQTILERFESINLLSFLVNPMTVLDEVIGLEKSRLDAKTTNVFYQKGFMHLYNYGIPYFFTESDINVDYRHGQNTLEQDFYPHNANLSEWLQEKNVSPKEDNTYFYNKTFSKQNKESFICVNQSSFDNRDCKVKHPNRIIYSEEQYTDDVLFDNWLIFKSNSFYDIPLTDGLLNSVDGVENDKILVRSENTSRIFNAYNVIQTDSKNLQVGTGGMFKTKPQEFSITDLGYTGSQHSDILHTEYGHIWVDAKRGNVFNLASGASGLDELSKDGMKHWFKENLPFEIKKRFPEVDVDNSMNNIGISLCFDRRFNNIYITKLDYKPLSPLIIYDSIDKVFKYNDSIIKITDTKYFCNKSWTISYNFFKKSWTSFHSFKPLYYNYFVDSFESGIDNSLWSHSVTNKSYQVYYGKLFPFIIEYISDASTSNKFLHSLEYSLDTIRFHNKQDYFYNRLVNFNKAIIYNDRQCSGLLELVISDPENLSQLFNYPKQLNDRTQVECSNNENIWRLNDFYDLVSSQVNNVPIWVSNCANDNKDLNPRALNYFKYDLDRARIRGKQCRVRLINDKYSNYKFIFNFAINNSLNSFS